MASTQTNLQRGQSKLRINFVPLAPNDGQEERCNKLQSQGTLESVQALKPQIFIDSSPNISLQDSDIPFAQRIKTALQSPQKNLQEAQLIYTHIKGFAFFKAFNQRNPNNNLEDEAFIQLCQRITYEKHPDNKVLFREGDTYNDKIYIVYSGAMLLFKKGSESATPRSADTDQHSEERDAVFSPSATDRASIKPKQFTSDNFKASSTDSSPDKDRHLFSPGTIDLSLTKDNKDSDESLGSLGHQLSVRLPKTQRTSIFARMNTNAIEVIEDKGEREEKVQEHIAKLVRITQVWKQQVHGGSFSGQPSSINFPGLNALSERCESPIANESAQAETEKPKLLKRMISMKRSKSRTGPSMLLKQSSSSCERSFAYKNQKVMSLSQIKVEYGQIAEKVTAEEFFGEEMLFSKQPRGFTAVTGSECELLTISKKDFRYVREKYDHRRNNLISFMNQYVPEFENIESPDAMDEIMNRLQEKTFEKDTVIAREGSKGNYLYILSEGHCELTKTLKFEDAPKAKKNSIQSNRMLRASSSNMQELIVCRVQRGEILGEEIALTDKDTYDLSIRVYSAGAKLFAVDKDEFMTFFPLATRQKIQKTLLMKRANHIEIINSTVARKYPQLEIDSQSDKKGNSHFNLLSQSPIRLFPRMPIHQADSSRRSLVPTMSLSTGFANVSNNNLVLNTKTAVSRVSILQSSRSFRDLNSVAKQEIIVSPTRQEKFIDSTTELSPTENLKKRLEAYSRMSRKFDRKSLLAEPDISHRNDHESAKFRLKIDLNASSLERDTDSPPLSIDKALRQNDLTSKRLRSDNIINKQKCEEPSSNQIPSARKNRSFFYDFQMDNQQTATEVSNESIDPSSAADNGINDYKAPTNETNDLICTNDLGFSLMNVKDNQDVRRRLNIKTRSVEKGREYITNQSSQTGAQYTFDKLVQNMLHKMQKKKQKRLNQITNLMSKSRPEGFLSEEPAQAFDATNKNSPPATHRLTSRLKKTPGPQLILQSSLNLNLGNTNNFLITPDARIASLERKLPNIGHSFSRDRLYKGMESNRSKGDSKDSQDIKGFGLFKSQSTINHRATKTPVNFKKYNIQEEYYSTKYQEPPKSFRINKKKISRGSSLERDPISALVPFETISSPFMGTEILIKTDDI